MIRTAESSGGIAARALAARDGDNAEPWSERIAAAWRSTTEAIFETGRLLIEAKARLPHGSFKAMVENQLPFKPSTAQRLMKVANDARLTNPAHVQLLPPAWGTLYELTKLPDNVFEARLADGSIYPEMQRKDVARENEKRFREAAR